MKMQTKTHFSSVKMLLAVVFAFLLTACGTPETATQDAKISYTYQAKDPISEEIVFSGEMLDQDYAPANSQIFELFSGAKKGESRFATLKDPFHQHNPELVKKIPLVVLAEMGIQLEDNAQTIEFEGKEYLIADIISENEVDKMLLDENPLQTVKELDWTFTLKEIK